MLGQPFPPLIVICRRDRCRVIPFVVIRKSWVLVSDVLSEGEDVRGLADPCERAADLLRIQYTAALDVLRALNSRNSEQPSGQDNRPAVNSYRGHEVPSALERELGVVTRLLAHAVTSCVDDRRSFRRHAS